MKLQNKKTGEIVVFGKGIVDLTKIGCKNVAEMMEAGWQDYEEQKEFWYICDFRIIRGIEGKFSTPDVAAFTREEIAKLEDIGNYFETEEEAKKAVEKQIIWTTLEDSGFKFTGWKRDKNDRDKLIIEAIDPMFRNDKDLDLLFGGEE